MARRKKANKGEVGDLTPAFDDPVTQKALAKITQRLLKRGLVGVVGVYGFNYVLHQFADGGGLSSFIAVGLEAVAFVTFMSAVYSYLSLVHVRRLLRAHPWVEWHARVANVEVFGVELLRVAVLAHPEWTEEEIRLITPTRAGRNIELGESTLWVAGSPSRTVVISGPGGNNPVRGALWYPGGLRRAFSKAAFKGASR